MVRHIYTVPLEIDAGEYQRMYAGEARTVIARDTGGLSIQFPAAALRPFVTREGVRGLFEIEVDGNGRLVEVRRRR